jgi:hypothetical protein
MMEGRATLLPSQIEADDDTELSVLATDRVGSYGAAFRFGVGTRGDWVADVVYARSGPGGHWDDLGSGGTRGAEWATPWKPPQDGWQGSRCLYSARRAWRSKTRMATARTSCDVRSLAKRSSAGAVVLDTNRKRPTAREGEVVLLTGAGSHANTVGIPPSKAPHGRTRPSNIEREEVVVGDSEKKWRPHPRPTEQPDHHARECHRPVIDAYPSAGA